MFFMFLSVAAICGTLAFVQAQHHKFLNLQNVQKDNAKLSAKLESELSQMKDLREKMRLLLIKQGFLRE